MRRKSIVSGMIVVLLFALGAASALAQGSGTELGAAPSGQNALELIGQIDQAGFNVTVYGYVTSVNGLASNLLFQAGISPLDRDETGARLTFTGSGMSQARSVHENIFSSDVAGSITFYWNETPSGITWDDPASFGAGVPVASLTLRLNSILNVQEPNIGVLLASADGTQDSATPFTVDGQSYQLGHSGQLVHYTLFGQGFRSSTEPLAAMYRFAGYSTVVQGAP